MQRSGLEAVGAFVARDFGEDGVFIGTVISFEELSDGVKLYRVKYSDGDIEDLDQEEYNYAYALKLQRDGWVVEEAQSGGEGPCKDSGGASEDGGSGNDSDDEYIVDQLMREKGKELEKEDSGDVDGVGSPSSKAKAVPLSAYEQLRQKNVVRKTKKL